jgi:hypothetical protein
MAQKTYDVNGVGASDSATQGGLAGPFDREKKIPPARRMSADTGSWLTGRPRFSAEAFGTINRDGGISSSTFRSS